MLNGFLKKEKIKFEDHKLALQYFEKNCFCIKFDLKSGYHHIDICKECQTFLGFECKGEYYCFTVLPFGLSTAPYIFTKCLRAMVKNWRSNNIKIVLYLDDGLAMAESFEECQRISSFIKSSVEDAGLLINQEKSIFSPVQDIEWLGIRWNSVRFSISVPERRIRDVEYAIVQFLSDLPKVSARALARVAGKIISLQPVFGNICRLMTRYCYMEIVFRVSWDNTLNFKFATKSINELKFWLIHVRKYNNKKPTVTKRESTIVYSDASAVGAGAFTVGVDEKCFHQMWNENEMSKSSTWREMKAIELALISFNELLFNKCVKWFTDNQSCVNILQSGSMNRFRRNSIYYILVLQGAQHFSRHSVDPPRQKSES